MKATIKLSALAMILAAASVTTYAAETADLAVRGTIRPSACAVNLSGNGVVDLGTISAQTLNKSSATALPSKDFSVSITCDAPTAIGIIVTDDRAGTANTSAATAISAMNYHMMGLGQVNDTTIGAYKLRVEESAPASADGTAAKLIYSDNDGGSWLHADRTLVRPSTRTMSWTATDSITPGAFTSITQSFSMDIAIASTSTLPELTDGIPIDGLATFTVVYL